MLDFFQTVGVVVMIGAVVLGTIFSLRLIRIVSENKTKDTADLLTLIFNYIAKEVPRILIDLKAIQNAPTNEDQRHILIDKVYDELIKLLNENKNKEYGNADRILAIIDTLGKETILGFINSLLDGALNRLALDAIVNHGGVENLSVSAKVYIGAGNREHDPATLA